MNKVLESLQEEHRARQQALEVSISSAAPPNGADETREASLEEEMIGLYRTINSALSDQDHACIQFIGSRAGEGTSTVVSHLAHVVVKRFGKSVVVVDGDTVRPAQHLRFGISPIPGWEDVLRGWEPLKRALRRIGNLNLYVCPSSARAEDVTRMSIATATKGLLLLATLSRHFDLVLIDSTPASLSPHEGVALCDKVNGVVLVVEAEATRWPIADATRERIIQSGGKLLGVVLNKRRYYIPELVYRHL